MVINEWKDCWIIHSSVVKSRLCARVPDFVFVFTMRKLLNFSVWKFVIFLDCCHLNGKMKVSFHVYWTLKERKDKLRKNIIWEKEKKYSPAQFRDKTQEIKIWKFLSFGFLCHCNQWRRVPQMWQQQRKKSFEKSLKTLHWCLNKKTCTRWINKRNKLSFPGKTEATNWEEETRRHQKLKRLW